MLAALGGNFAMVVYNAFISYSHAKDKPVAGALQSVMQRLGKPWYRRRAMRIFRDDTTLSATPSLWPSIEQALAQSQFLILVASPEAAASQWVNKEIAYWLEYKSADTLLIALTDGELHWDSSLGDFVRNPGTPLPPAVISRFATEPKWVDLRGYRVRPNRYTARFVELAADFAATVLGVAKDDLLSEEVRQQRRALTLAWSTAASFLVLMGAAVWQWNAAVKSETRAERNFVAAKSTIDTVILDLAQGLKDVEGMRVETVRRILEQAQKAVSQLAARTENDPRVLSSQGAMLYQFSETYLRLGDSQLAYDYAQQSLSIGRDLAAKDPSDPAWQRNHSTALELVGQILTVKGDLNGALVAFRDGLEIQRKLSARDPDNTELRWLSSLFLDKIGRVLLNQNDLSGAL